MNCVRGFVVYGVTGSWVHWLIVCVPVVHAARLSQECLIDGLPFKHGYKRFKIRTVEGVDDFGSMREVVSRRLRRLQQEHGKFPDILLIDGGKGQLNAALGAMETIGVTSPPPFVISLAKREEEVYVPGEAEPRKLSRHSFALRLLQYVRDESHRFAQHYHHILRRKSTFNE